MKDEQEKKMADTTSIDMMDEREIARMIRAQRSPQSPQRQWGCPSAEEVAAYLEQRLAAEPRARFEAHIAGCDACIRLVGALARQQEAAEVAGPPAILVQRAIDAVQPPGSAGGSWRWMWAPALAAVVVISAVLLKSPQPRTSPTADVPAPPVTLTKPAEPAAAQNPPLSPDVQTRSKPAPAAVRSLKVPMAAPQLLEPRAGSLVPRDGVRFRWEPVAHAISYEIRVVDPEGSPVWKTESASTSAELPAGVSLSPGRYFVWVRAHLSDGRTAKSDTIAFQVRNSN